MVKLGELKPVAPKGLVDVVSELVAVEVLNSEG
jgi:hypothetical protein